MAYGGEMSSKKKPSMKKCAKCKIGSKCKCKKK